MTEDEVARLYRDYGYIVYRRCVLFLGDPRAARDALHEVFVRLLRAETEFLANPQRRMWLCRLSDRLCLDMLGRDGTVRTDITFDEALASIMDDDRDSLVAVRQLLEGLHVDEWRLAVLHYVDEFTEQEIAKELGLSLRTVERRVAALVEHTREVLRVENAS